MDSLFKVIIIKFNVQKVLGHTLKGYLDGRILEILQACWATCLSSTRCFARKHFLFSFHPQLNMTWCCTKHQTNLLHACSQVRTQCSNSSTHLQVKAVTISRHSWLRLSICIDDTSYPSTLLYSECSFVIAERYRKCWGQHRLESFWRTGSLRWPVTSWQLYCNAWTCEIQAPWGCGFYGYSRWVCLFNACVTLVSYVVGNT